jgi:hypothetical protein
VESRAFEWAPLSVSRRRSRGLRKTPQWGAERRAGPRYGPAVPSRRRDRPCRKAGQRVRRSAPANFGAPLPSVGGAKGSKPTIWHDSPPGCAARQRSRTPQHMHGENDDAEIEEDNHRSAVSGRCGRRCRRRGPKGNAAFWQNETEVSFWQNEPEVFDGRTMFWQNEPEVAGRFPPGVTSTRGNCSISCPMTTGRAGAAKMPPKSKSDGSPSCRAPRPPSPRRSPPRC